ncbi:hypothetical protein AOLI_G00164070 [Acnodon oligacanthus]
MLLIQAKAWTIEESSSGLQSLCAALSVILLLMANAQLTVYLYEPCSPDSEAIESHRHPATLFQSKGLTLNRGCAVGQTNHTGSAGKGRTGLWAWRKHSSRKVPLDLTTSRCSQGQHFTVLHETTE